MMNSQFHDVITTLRKQMTGQGVSENPGSELSKILEINNTLRQVDVQLDMCKSTLIDSLTSHETAIAMLTRLEDEREKITISHNNLSNYADTVRTEMLKIAKVRNTVLSLINENDDEEYENKRALEEQNKLRETLDEVKEEREDVLREIAISDRRIESLTKELNDTKMSTMLEKIENDALHAKLEHQLDDIINRNQTLMNLHENLLKTESYLNIDTPNDYCG